MLEPNDSGLTDLLMAYKLEATHTEVPQLLFLSLFMEE